ncbi:terpene synthase family protein [Streptomyces sp. 3211]|uniref:terpene synthase family protein n=1 Tax=Streptomyces sp. 3211 TaxID=1964449 RepID=UPI001331BF76|nr:hypothetical protein [Streptomyces sp. 3211]
MFISENSTCYHPLEPAIHPMAAEIDERAVSWMHSFGLGANNEARERMVHYRVGQLASRIVPDGHHEGLQIFADFLTWIFALDDEYCDEGMLGSKPGELADAVSRMLCAFESPESLIEDPADRYSHALRDLRLRLETCATSSQIGYLSGTLGGYLLSEVRKAGYVSAGRHPRSLDSYVPMLMQNGGTLAMIAFPPIVQGYEVPLSLLQSHPARAVTEMCATIANCDSDILSYSKGWIRSGHGFNTIDVICREYHCSEQAAFIAVKGMRDQIMELFLRMFQHLSSHGVPNLDRYMAGLHRYMRGVIDWHSETDRYVHSGRVKEDCEISEKSEWGDPVSVLQCDPLLTQATAWWWRYDPYRRPEADI